MFDSRQRDGTQWTHRLNQEQLDSFLQQLDGGAGALQKMSERVERLEMDIARAQSMSHVFAGKTAKSAGKVRDIRQTVDDNLSTFVYGIDDWNREVPGKIEELLDNIGELDVQKRADDIARLFMSILFPIIILIGEITVSNAYVTILVSRVVDRRFQTFIMVQAMSIIVLLFMVFIFLLWLLYGTTLFRDNTSSVRDKTEKVEEPVASPDPVRRNARSWSVGHGASDSVGLHELRATWDRAHDTFSVPWKGRFSRTEDMESDATVSISGEPAVPCSAALRRSRSFPTQSPRPVVLLDDGPPLPPPKKARRSVQIPATFTLSEDDMAARRYRRRSTNDLGRGIV